MGTTENEQVSQRPYSSVRVPSGKQKAGRSRCFHDLLKSWEREGQGTALLFGKTRASQEAAKPAAPRERGRSSSHAGAGTARNCHPRRPAPARSELPSRCPPLRRCPSRGDHHGLPKARVTGPRVLPRLRGGRRDAAGSAGIAGPSSARRPLLRDKMTHEQRAEGRVFRRRTLETGAPSPALCGTSLAPQVSVLGRGRNLVWRGRSLQGITDWVLSVCSRRK